MQEKQSTSKKKGAGVNYRLTKAQGLPTTGQIQTMMNNQTDLPQKYNSGQVWWHVLLTTALGRQRQEDLCNSEARLVQIVSFRTARAM